MAKIEGKQEPQAFSVALVVGRFNQDVTDLLIQGATQRLAELEIPEDKITTVSVAGAVEIPITAKRLAETDNYDAIICLAAVIRGETSHYDHVCEQLSYGCQRVALDYGIPVVFGVLTTENKEQALARAGGEKGHKGQEAVDVAFDMVSVLRQIT